MPRASTSNSSGSDLAPARGSWIMKTQAYSQYRLGPSDLRSIRPTSIETNSSGRGLIYKYNLCDVQLIHAKVVEMARTLQVGAPAGETVPQHGRTIVRTAAKKEYDLHDNQIDRIRPCRVLPNPHRSNATPMRIYNLSDVQALVHGIEGLRDMEAPEAARIEHDASPSTSRRSLDPDYNFYDGWSADDAAAHLAGVFAGASRPKASRRSRNRATPY